MQRKKKQRGIKLSDLPQRYQDQIRNQIAVQTPKLEQRIKSTVEKADAVKEMVTPVRIRIHQKRKRLVDIDNVYSKAVIDGIRSSGLIRDDTPDILKSVTYSQEKVKECEETIIIIESV